MKFSRTISIIFIVEFIFTMHVLADDTLKKEQFLGSFSGVLSKVIFQQNKISTIENVLNDEKLINAYWPSYDEENKILYFVARDKLEQRAGTNIYRISLPPIDQEPIKLIDNARHPSLSPDNKLLAFYRHPNQLWVYSIENRKFQKAVINIANYQPCVWISNTSLLYIDLDNDLLLFDVSKGEMQKTDFSNIVPGALSPDGKKVLCGSSDGMKIYFYFPFSNELEVIKESKIRSMGTTFVWLPCGDGFLFTMQTWSNLLKFDESRALYLFNLSDKEESFLLDKIALFGGTYIP